MSKKKSYMDKSNILNEGILDKIFSFIKRGKLKRLQQVLFEQGRFSLYLMKSFDF